MVSCRDCARRSGAGDRDEDGECDGEGTGRQEDGYYIIEKKIFKSYFFYLNFINKIYSNRKLNLVQFS